MLKRSTLFVSALVAISAPALAWQESPQGRGPGGTPARNLDLSIPPAEGEEQSGTEIRVPGVGTLGVLPRLDFGLELLYGDGAARPEDKSQPSDVQVRGTLKYRF